MNFVVIVGALSLVSVIAGAQEPSAPDVTPPNVVLIYTDDQGYADLGCYGARGFETPRLDQLAAEGLKLESFYVSQATCTSSRASIRTGCYANRIGVVGAYGPNAGYGLHADEETLAELLHERGYATGFVGKWHLGDRPQFLPTRHGYDEWLGLPYSNDMWPVDYDGKPVSETDWKKRFPPLPLMDGDETVELVEDLADQARLTRRYTARAIDFIERSAPKGLFFLELAHSMPHVPLGAAEEFRGTTEYGPYGDVIAEIDHSVGEVLDALQRVGVADRTLVIFTSDNGPWLNFGDHAGSALPLKEGKGTSWEGGCRVPCIVRYPGVVPAGSQSKQLAATIDLLPTVVDVCDAREPRLEIDGVSLLSHFRDPETPSPRTTYWHYYLNELEAVREGRWKLHLPHDYRSYERLEPGVNGHPGPTAIGRVSLALYDIQEDPGERRDVSDRHPEIVARLSKLADAAREALGDGSSGGTGTREAGRVESPRSR